MSDWISVEDRLPPDELKLYLVAIGPRHWIYICEYADETWYADLGKRMRLVTHWMPLPEPPDSP